MYNYVIVYLIKVRFSLGISRMRFRLDISRMKFS